MPNKKRGTSWPAVASEPHIEEEDEEEMVEEKEEDSEVDIDAILAKTPKYEGMPSWKPGAPGEYLAGILALKERKLSQDGTDKLVLSIRDRESGRIVPRWCNAQLEQQVLDQDPRVGDLICIRYDGKAKVAKGFALNFTLIILRRADKEE